MRALQSDVLFVNIGWAERYDGRHVIEGSHDWVQSHSGRPSEISEGSAFLMAGNLSVQCGVGYGRVTPDQQVDVVFVARNPALLKHEVVGIYFEPIFSYGYAISQHGKRLVWAVASAELFLEMAGSQRPRVKWPSGRSMRRWAKRLGVVNYPQLSTLYERLISIYQGAEGEC